ncbi:MAG: phage tail tape measure protein, partial [Pseudomonadota bacterium]
RQMPVPFASGGVVTAPTAFSFGSGQLGVMGEAGAEAILPLARGADGRLGVRGGGRSVAVTFNVSTPDAESFKSSEAQVGALLSRVIARGERNL